MNKLWLVGLCIFLLPLVQAVCTTPTNGQIFSASGTYIFCSGSHSLPSGIRVNVSSVTIDCNGSTMYRTSSTGGAGITVSGAIFSNITIQNCNISGYQYAGIQVANWGSPAHRVNGVIIRNNDIRNVSDATGMFLWGMDNFEVYNNTIHDLWDTYDLNTSTGGGCGAHGIYFSADTAIASNNTVNGSIHDNTIYNLVTGTGIKSNNKYTMYNTRIYNNNISNIRYRNDHGIARCGQGIQMTDTDNFEVYNNTITNVGGNAILVDNGDSSFGVTNGAKNHRVHDNIINNITDGYGMWIKQYAKNNTFYNNSFGTMQNSEYRIDNGTNASFYESDSIIFTNNLYLGKILYLNFTGAKNFTINSWNFTIINGLSQWSPYNDVKNATTILASNIDNYSRILSNLQPLTVGEFGLQIENVSDTTINTTSVTVTWDTLVASNSSVNYGLTTALGTIVAYNDANTSHSVEIGGLSAGNNYYYQITSRNSTENGSSGVYQFATTSEPPTITNVTVTVLNTSAVQINWSTTLSGDTKILYGTTTALGSEALIDEVATEHSIIVENLLEGKYYYFNVSSTNNTFGILTPLRDSSNNNYTLTESGGIVYDNTKGWYVADGINDYLTTTTLNNRIENMTLTFAYNVSSADTTTPLARSFFYMGNSTMRYASIYNFVNSSYSLWGRIQADVKNSTFVAVYMNSPISFRNQISFVTVTIRINATEIAYYRDGVLNGTATFAGAPISTATNITKLQFFADTPAGKYHKGIMDNISIYNTALTDAEILSVSQGTVLTTQPSFLVGYWTFTNNTINNTNTTISGVYDFTTLNYSVNINYNDSTSSGNYSVDEIDITTYTTSIGFNNITIYLYNTSGLYASNFSTLSLANFLFSNLPDGNYSYNATAYDILGRSYELETVENINISSNLTSLDFVSPSTTAGNYIRNYIEVNVSVNGTGFSSFTLYLYNASELYTQEMSLTQELFINFTSLPDGNYSYNVTAYDTDGVAYYSSTVEGIVLDTTVPVITVTVPIATTYSSSNVSINFSSSESGSLWYYNGSVNVTYTVPTSVVLADGSYSWIFYGNDSVNNIGFLVVNFSVFVPVSSGGGATVYCFDGLVLVGGVCVNLSVVLNDSVSVFVPSSSLFGLPDSVVNSLPSFMVDDDKSLSERGLFVLIVLVVLIVVLLFVGVASWLKKR